MSMFKNIVALVLAILMLFTLFIPSFAVESEVTEADLEELDSATDGDEAEAETDAPAETSAHVIIENVIINPERVMDYSKMYHLASVTLKECSKVKWYLLKENGVLFNAGAENEHHGSTYEILWNALDVNGTHPAGAWNAPVGLRLSLVIVATGINGEEEYAAGWFTYYWYDNECPSGACSAPTAPEPAATPTAPSAAPARTNDVPHTGL